MHARITGSHTRPVEITQGMDKTLTLWVSDDLTSATEVEYVIDSPTRISKALTTGVTVNSASQVTIQIDAADTTNIVPGPYKQQMRATLSGKLTKVKIQPNKIRITDSVWVDEYVAGDYN